jgi:acetoin utilization protein AcuB
VLFLGSDRLNDPIGHFFYFQTGGSAMLVKDWMSREVITIEEDDSMQEALKLLKEHAIRMLPVMKKGKLVGIVTDRDLKKASPSDATTLEVHELLYLLTQIKVKEIMTRDPITVPPDYTVEETAQVLLENKISGAPVMDKTGKVIGTITQTDLFRVLISLTGVASGGIQFGFYLEDKPGSIKEVADIIRQYGGRMVSILTSYGGVADGYRNVFIRMHSVERSKIQSLKDKLSEKATLLYMIDQRQNKREIFSGHDK